MRIDPNKFAIDESRSNPMVVAMKYEDCPINQICFFAVIGFGTITDKCEHFKEAGEYADCEKSTGVEP
jgi:hypothetical protein